MTGAMLEEEHQFEQGPRGPIRKSQRDLVLNCA